MRKDFKQSTGRVVHTISCSLVHNAANPTSEGSPYTKWRPFKLTLLGILKMSLIYYMRLNSKPPTIRNLRESCVWVVRESCNR